jgi:hypothetical protein
LFSGSEEFSSQIIDLFFQHLNNLNVTDFSTETLRTDMVHGPGLMKLMDLFHQVRAEAIATGDVEIVNFITTFCERLSSNEGNFINFLYI